MQKIVFISEEAETLEPFLHYLHDRGYAALTLHPGSENLQPEVAAADVIVVDLATAGDSSGVLSLPQTLGLEDSVAVIALLSPEQLAVLEPGARLDDFLLRQSTAEELLARLRSVLWRKTRPGSGDALRFGDLVIDAANYKVFLGGKHVELTYKEYELLRFLASNRDRVFSREALLNEVWGYDYYGGGRTVDVHIRRLRSKIEDIHHTFIETVRNVGYRFHG